MSLRSSIWSLRATLLWALLIAGIFIGVQALTASLYVHFATAGLLPSEKQRRYEALINDGDLLAVVTISSGLIATLLTMAVTALKAGGNLWAYLGLRGVQSRQLLKWCLWFIVLLLALELLSLFMDDGTSSDFMREVYQSADSKLLLFVAVVVVASLFEELFFRGFLLEGLRYTALGAGGSVLLTALLWSLVHVQYDLLGMTSIFLIGLFLGLVRLRTGSTSLTIFLHGLNNALAFMVLAYLNGQLE